MVPGGGSGQLVDVGWHRGIQVGLVHTGVGLGGGWGATWWC